MTVLYPNLHYNEVCYKGTALYSHFSVSALEILCSLKFS